MSRMSDHAAAISKAMEIEQAAVHLAEQRIVGPARLVMGRAWLDAQADGKAHGWDEFENWSGFVKRGVGVTMLVAQRCMKAAILYDSGICVPETHDTTTKRDPIDKVLSLLWGMSNDDRNRALERITQEFGT